MTLQDIEQNMISPAPDNQYINHQNDLDDFVKTIKLSQNKITVYSNKQQESPELLLKSISQQHHGMMSNDIFGDIRTIRFDPGFSNNSVALSADAHPLHTDGRTKLSNKFSKRCVYRVWLQ